MSQVVRLFQFWQELFRTNLLVKVLSLALLAGLSWLIKVAMQHTRKPKIKDWLKLAKQHPEQFQTKLKQKLAHCIQNTKALAKRIWFVVPAFALLTFGNALFRLLYAIPFVNRQRKRFEKEAKPVFRFKTWRSVATMGTIGMFFASVLTNYVVNILRGLIGFLYELLSSIHLSDLSSKATSVLHPTFDWSILLANHLLDFSTFVYALILAIPIFILLSVIAWKSAWINFEQYRDYNANESGDDQFTEDGQIFKEYKKIPDKAAFYEGKPIIPLVHVNSCTLQGAALGAKMKWRNSKWGKLLSQSTSVLGLANKPTGYYYGDDDTVNVIITGMTRSGKGETFVNPLIDIISRAGEPSSMVVSDPKGELYQSSYRTLRKRGFEVEVLNFQNMDWSMSYNPLALAIDSAKKGYYEKTQTRVNAVSESIYRKAKQGDGNAKYWEDTSISLFNGIAMALIDRANETFKNGEEDAWDTVTIRNIVTFLTELGSEEVLVDGDGNEIKEPEQGQQLQKTTKLTLYFDNLRKINQKRFSKFREMADINFRSSDFSSEETKGNIYSSMLSGVNLYLQDDIAKLTSKNSIDLESVGNPRRLSIKFSNSTITGVVNPYGHQTVKLNILGKEGRGLNAQTKAYVKNASAIVDGEGYLNYVIQPNLPDQFTVQMAFTTGAVAGQNFEIKARKEYELNGFRKAKDQYTGKHILTGVKSEIVKQVPNSFLAIDFAYSDSPKAVFLVTPPNRMEYNDLVAFFINQLFNANYEVALSAGRKTTNRIQFILDEFANIPRIPYMDQKLSIGLGQNMQFMLIVQNLEQLDDASIVLWTHFGIISTKRKAVQNGQKIRY